jgi:hypothetical protein
LAEKDFHISDKYNFIHAQRSCTRAKSPRLSVAGRAFAGFESAEIGCLKIQTKGWVDGHKVVFSCCRMFEGDELEHSATIHSIVTGTKIGGSGAIPKDDFTNYDGAVSDCFFCFFILSY